MVEPVTEHTSDMAWAMEIRLGGICAIWDTFIFWIIMKSILIHIVLFFTLVLHLYYLAKIYNKIILYE